jgi:hypothetical protein
LSSDAVATANDYLYLSREQHGVCFTQIVRDAMITLFELVPRLLLADQ